MTPDILAGVLMTRAPASDTDAVLDRLGSTLVRRMANQHDCTGARCHHRNHARDVAYLRAMLSVLGLTGVPAETADYDGPAPWVSFSREETALWGRL